ncbi:MAG: hypothetical protein ACJA0Q_000981 [Saprospiraceae bacterium]|jgi:hypothetical protein
MDFSKEDKDCLLNNLNVISTDYKEFLGGDLKSIQELGTLLLDQDISISEMILNQNRHYLLKEENSRIIVFYSFLKMLGKERLNQLNFVLLAKETGLKLGLNSIGVAQLVFKIRQDGFSAVRVRKIVKLFKVYNN